MSSGALSSLFNRSPFANKCKTCLNMAISRIKLLQNRRELQLINMRKEIFQYLRTNQETIARIRVEHVVREQNVLAAYEIIGVFCEFVLARVLIIDSQRECPPELLEAISSIIFASSRCSDLPELTPLCHLFGTKYGKDFVSAALELRPDCGVNRTIIEKLSVRAPSAETKLKVLKSVAQEYSLDWDSSNTEVEFNKKFEDLLDGPKSGVNHVTVVADKSSIVTALKARPSAGAVEEGTTDQTRGGPSSIQANKSGSGLTSSSITVVQETNNAVKHPAPQDTLNTMDVLEKARAAIAAADRAASAARSAANLLNAKLQIK